MKNNIDISKLASNVGSFFSRFHITIFFVTIVAGLSFAILSLNSLIGSASDTTNSSDGGPSQSVIDQTVIERIDALHTSDDAPSSVTLPTGRTNPFVE